VKPGTSLARFLKSAARPKWSGDGQALSCKKFRLVQKAQMEIELYWKIDDAAERELQKGSCGRCAARIRRGLQTTKDEALRWSNAAGEGPADGPAARGQNDQRARRRHQFGAIFQGMIERFPTGLGVLKRFGKGVGIGTGEAAVSVVKQNRNRAAERFGGEHQVERAIAVDVAGHDLQAAGEREDRNQLAAVRAHPEFNPILGTGEFVVAGLDVNQVGAKIAVKVIERGAQRGGCGMLWRREIFSRAQYAGWKQGGEKEQEKSASESDRGHAVAPAGSGTGDGGSVFHDTF